MKQKIQASFLFLQVLFFAFSFLVLPSATFAASFCSNVSTSLQIENGTTKIADVLNFGTCLIERSVIPLAFSIATIVFIYGVIKFIREEKAEEREKGRQFMLWGIIAFAVMFGVWGFVAILGNTFGVSNVLPILPQSSTP